MAEAASQKRVLPARERGESAAKRRVSSPAQPPAPSPTATPAVRKQSSTPAQSTEPPRQKRKYTKRASLVRVQTPTSRSSPAPSATDEVLPTRVLSNKPLPTLKQKQPTNLSQNEYQSIAESAILVASLHRSRMQWLCDGIFQKYWVKPVKRKGVVTAPPNNPELKSMTKLGSATIAIEPHIFDAVFYVVRDPAFPAPYHRHANQHTAKQNMIPPKAPYGMYPPPGPYQHPRPQPAPQPIPHQTSIAPPASSPPQFSVSNTAGPPAGPPTGSSAGPPAGPPVGFSAGPPAGFSAGPPIGTSATLPATPPALATSPIPQNPPVPYPSSPHGLPANSPPPSRPDSTAPNPPTPANPIASPVINPPPAPVANSQVSTLNSPPPPSASTPSAPIATSLVPPTPMDHSPSPLTTNTAPVPPPTSSSAPPLATNNPLPSTGIAPPRTQSDPASVPPSQTTFPADPTKREEIPQPPSTAPPRPAQTGSSAPSPREQSQTPRPTQRPNPPSGGKGSTTDPVIQMLAARAATDHQLKELMKVVATSKASPEQLREFQGHIDEFNEVIRRQESERVAKKDEKSSSRTPLHPPGPAPQERPRETKPDAKPPTPTPATPVPPPKPSPPVKAPPTATYNPPKPPQRQPPGPIPPQMGPGGLPGVMHTFPHHPPAAGRGGPMGGYAGYAAPLPAPPPPRPEPIIKHIVMEITSTPASGHPSCSDRWLFPEHAVLEIRYGGLEMVCSFFVERRGSELSPAGEAKTEAKADEGAENDGTAGKWKADQEYYQPVTMTVKATNHRTIETIARAAKPLPVVQEYMKGVMEKKERAPVEYLVHQLPRERSHVGGEGSEAGFVDSGVELGSESGSEDDELKEVYGI